MRAADGHWSTGESVTYRVRHHYRYVYTAPVHEMKQKLVMVPPDRHGDQLLRSWSLDVRGATGECVVDWSADAFGNRVCRVAAEQVAHAIDFEATFLVTRDPSGGHSEHVAPDMVERFGSHTGLTAPDERIEHIARQIATRATSFEQQAELAHDWAAQAITYESGVTGTQTPAAMALHLRRGVCQDYAHIMLSVLRCLGLPCRYVSGHLLGEGAPHAWVEVLLPSGETRNCNVVAYDPTHHRRADASYITVAVGRDFADVTMTSGVFSGAASGRLHWSKHAERVDGKPDLERQAAAA
jgi:transglutaminase-like putative cysteine protease